MNFAKFLKAPFFTEHLRQLLLSNVQVFIFLITKQRDIFHSRKQKIGLNEPVLGV